jgi:putative flavoprotein involved in K+ transport
MNRVPTVVIGAGQAGLAASRVFSDAGHEHVVLERGRVAERWRSERWDSFRLLTPNWMTRLPGYSYTGRDVDGFMRRDQVVRFFDGYAASFGAPVVEGVTVSRVGAAGDEWLVETTAGEWVADDVVVATGHYDVPARPSSVGSLGPSVQEMFARDYRSPAQLPEGGVLVVGAGPSGQQIADEVARAGRPAFIAVGGHRGLPRRYRGRDSYWCLDTMGALLRSVDTLDDPWSTANARSVVLAGGDDDLDLYRLAAHGVVPVGRLIAADGSSLRFAGDLVDSVAGADGNRGRFRAEVDAFVDRTGMTVPREDWRPRPLLPWATEAPTELDMRAAGIRTVVWAAGYRRDYSWVDAPVFAPNGEPVQRRGVTPAPGLHFLGLRWMHRRNSNFIDGVGADATYLARRITRQQEAVA